MALNVRLANEAWEALFTAHTRLIRTFQETDIWEELSMREYDVLYTLSKCDGPVRLGSLRDGVLLSQPALSRLVDRLVERGLVSRQDDAADRRAVGLELTEAGRELQRRIGRAHAKHVAEELTTLGDAELEQLRALCTKLITPRSAKD